MNWVNVWLLKHLISFFIWGVLKVFDGSYILRRSRTLWLLEQRNQTQNDTIWWRAWVTTAFFFFFFFLACCHLHTVLGCRSPVIMRSLQRRSLIVGSFLSWRLLFKHHWPETSQKIYEGFSTGSEKCVWYFDRSANFTGAFIKNGRIVSLATKIFLVFFFKTASPGDRGLQSWISWPSWRFNHLNKGNMMQ